jgi:transcriptional regulator with XRE-family HTH domain
MVMEVFFPTAQNADMKKAVESRIPREMYPDRIGQRLRIIREAFGLKPAEIADLLGIERTYWSRFEGGKRAVSDEVAYLLTVRFGVTLDFLLLGKWDKLPFDVAEKLRTVPGEKNT